MKQHKKQLKARGEVRGKPEEKEKDGKKKNGLKSIRRQNKAAGGGDTAH